MFDRKIMDENAFGRKGRDRILWSTPRQGTELNWTKAQLARGKAERFTLYVMVSPALAKDLLKHNSGKDWRNRTKSPAQVQKHCERLEAGTFRLTHQGLAVTRDDRLGDGQHRLSAVVKTGVDAPLTMTFGCEPDEFSAYDSGRARTAGNLLSIEGYKCADATAAAVSLIHMATQGGYPDAQKILDWVTARFLSEDDDNELVRAVRAGSRAHTVTNGAAAATAHYLINLQSRHAATRLEPFFQKFCTGAGDVDRAMSTLRSELIAGHLSRGNGQTTSVRRINAIVRTWNLQFQKGRKLPNFADPKLPTSKIEEIL